MILKKSKQYLVDIFLLKYLANWSLFAYFAALFME